MVTCTYAVVIRTWITLRILLLCVLLNFKSLKLAFSLYHKDQPCYPVQIFHKHYYSTYINNTLDLYSTYQQIKWECSICSKECRVVHAHTYVARCSALFPLARQLACSYMGNTQHYCTVRNASQSRVRSCTGQTWTKSSWFIQLAHRYTHTHHSQWTLYNVYYCTINCAMVTRQRAAFWRIYKSSQNCLKQSMQVHYTVCIQYSIY